MKVNKNAFFWLSPLVCFFIFLYLSYVNLNLIPIKDQWIHVQIPIRMLNNNFLPGRYGYPSMVFIIDFASALIGQFFTISNNPDFTSIHTNLTQYFNSNAYLLILKYVYASIAAMSIPIISYAYYLHSKSKNSLLFTPLFYLSSWELLYHSRWPSPDIIANTLFTIYVLAAVKFLQHERKSYLYMITITAGLATSTKYTYGILLLPILGLILFSKIQLKLKLIIHMILMYTVSFLCITPGAILEFKIFLPWLARVNAIYNEKLIHMRVENQLSYLFLEGKYYIFYSLSGIPLVAFGFTILALIGIYSCFIKNKQLTYVLLTLFIIQNLFFSFYQSLVVRNLLVSITIWLWFAMCGFTYVEAKLTGWVRGVYITLITAMIICSLQWQYYAVKSVSLNTSISIIQTYIKQNSHKKIYLSTLARWLYLSDVEMNYPNIVLNQIDSDETIHLAKEGYFKNPYVRQNNVLNNLNTNYAYYTPVYEPFAIIATPTIDLSRLQF